MYYHLPLIVSQAVRQQIFSVDTLHLSLSPNPLKPLEETEESSIKLPVLALEATVLSSG